jgi:RNA polymerase sigma-70 factor (ECF subfamily)
MSDQRRLAEQFERHRDHLRGVAYRILGSLPEADDAVQEAWMRLAASEPVSVQNLRAWLTTVVARICFNLLRARTVRRAEPLDGADLALGALSPDRDAESEVALADSVGLALLVVLERLSPPERLAFVLHDLFDLPFREIAPIVGRSETATRQLASRARRRVRGVEQPADPDGTDRREVVEAFLAASRRGDFEGLLALLDPEVELRIDATLGAGIAEVVRGPRAVVAEARSHSDLLRFCRIAGVNGEPGILIAPHGRLSRVLTFRMARGRIAEIDVIADPLRVERLDLAVIDREDERPPHRADDSPGVPGGSDGA